MKSEKSDKKVIRGRSGRLMIRRGVRFLESSEPDSPKLHADCKVPSVRSEHGKGRGIHPEIESKDD